MNITSGWTIAVIAVAALVQPATPRAQFDCAITKVVITNTPEIEHVSPDQGAAQFLD